LPRKDIRTPSWEIGEGGRVDSKHPQEVKAGDATLKSKSKGPNESRQKSRESLTKREGIEPEISQTCRS